MGNYLIKIFCLLLTSNFYMQTIIGANIINNIANFNRNINDTHDASTKILGAVNSTKSTRNRQINGITTYKGEFTINILL